MRIESPSDLRRTRRILETRSNSQRKASEADFAGVATEPLDWRLLALMELDVSSMAARLVRSHPSSIFASSMSMTGMSSRMG